MNEKYTSEELMVRLKLFIGVCLALTFVGIVFVVLYSLIFVTQPMDSMSPNDSKFFELIIPLATFLTGTLSGVMLGHVSGEKEEPEPESEERRPRKCMLNESDCGSESQESDNER